MKSIGMPTFKLIMNKITTNKYYEVSLAMSKKFKYTLLDTYLEYQEKKVNHAY